jgi:ribosomal protein L11 methyltransferase
VSDGWHAVRVWPASDRRSDVLAALFAHGSMGVHDDGPSLVTCFPNSVDLAPLVAALDGVRVEVSPVDDSVWRNQWRGTVGAHVVGALTVAPPWLADGMERGRTIVIDPGMAFGTGEHATTRGVLALMQGVVRGGDVVADLGAGSAVLAIAAAKLGARRVAAIEFDEEAIGNAEENVVANGVGERVSVIHGDAMVLLPLLAPVRVVTANIISSVLVELLPVIRGALAPGGEAILSGILTTERDQMMAVLANGGWRVTAEVADGEWWSVAIA